MSNKINRLKKWISSGKKSRIATWSAGRQNSKALAGKKYSFFRTK